MWFSWPNYIKWLLWCFQSHGDVLHSLSFSNLDGNQTLGFGESTNDVRLIFVQNLEIICQFPGKNCRWMGDNRFISNALLSFQVEQSGQRWGKISHDDFLDVLWNKDGDQMTEFKVWRELTTQKKNWKILSFLRNVNIFIFLNALMRTQNPDLECNFDTYFYSPIFLWYFSAIFCLKIPRIRQFKSTQATQKESKCMLRIFSANNNLGYLMVWKALIKFGKHWKPL